MSLGDPRGLRRLSDVAVVLIEDPREIAPGESVARRLTLPALGPGRYAIEIDWVGEGVTWFALAGSGNLARNFS